VSVAARSRLVTVRAPVRSESPTGAEVVTMTPTGTVRVSITQLSERAIASLGVKHAETTHLIIASARGITRKHDLLDGAIVYRITSVVPTARRTLIYASVQE